MRKSFAAAAALIGIISTSACNKQPEIITTMYHGEITACLRDSNELVLDVLQEITFKSKNKGKLEVAENKIFMLVQEHIDDVEDSLREELKGITFDDLNQDEAVIDLRPAMKDRHNNFASKINDIPNVEIIEIKHMEVTTSDVLENGCDNGNMPQPSQTSL